MRVACTIAALACALAACKREAAPQGGANATVAPAASVAAASTALPPGPPPPVAPPPRITGDTVLPATLRGDDSIDSLRKRFGGAQLEAGEVPGAEEMVPGAILYPDDPTRRAYLYFEDDEHLRGLSLVRVVDLESRWQLPSGVRMGMPLSELVRRNGGRMQFTGFGWDYGGTISNWNNGRLQPMPGQGRFSLRTREGVPDTVALPEGEGEVWSDDAKFPTMGEDVVVGELVFGFPKDADQSSNR